MFLTCLPRLVEVGEELRSDTPLARARVQMRRFLDKHPQNCGISAANFRVYDSFMLLRTNDGVGYIEMYNPRYEVSKNTPFEDVKEVKLLCEAGAQGASTVRRARKITVTYENFSGDTVTTRMSSAAAYCVQHFAEILSGKWPCSANQSSRVPADPWAFGAGDHMDL